MKRFLFSIFIAYLLMASAHAADLPTKAPYQPPVVGYNWNGFYAGGNFGYGWDTTGTPAFITSANAQTFFGSLATSPQGVTGGVQVGYNYQAPGSFLVLGIEGDINIAALNGTGTAPGLLTTTSVNQDWFATLRARLGVSFVPHMLLYVTGGGAYGGVKASTVDFAGAAASFNQGKGGWTWGGGIETEFTRNWSVGLEYLRVDEGKVSLQTVNAVMVNPTFQGDIVRAKVNYHF
jgi:outer membrane immunogenic protein